MSTATASSFSKALALGEIHEELVFPYPEPEPNEARKVRGLIAAFRDYADERIDPVAIDETGTITDQVYADLGERGLMGLYSPRSTAGSASPDRLLPRLRGVRPGRRLADGRMGVHQSIGMKPCMVLFGTDEQKARWLPDLASGRKLAAFVLTEPNVGSDAYALETRAERQSDGSWLLNGEKRWIGNGGDGDTFVVFARAEVDG